MAGLTVLLALLAALTNGAVSVLQRRAAVGPRRPDDGARRSSGRVGRAPERAGERPVERLGRTLCNGWWLGGVAAMLLAGGFQAGALASGPVSVVQPLLASELLFTLVVGLVVFADRPSGRTWTMFAMLACGLALFLVAADPLPGSGSAPGGRWAVAGAAAALLVTVLMVVAGALGGQLRAALSGAAAAVGWACTAALIKECATLLQRHSAEALLTGWPLYALAATGLSSFLLLQYALRAGSLAASQPALTLCDAAVSTVLGWALFGERIHVGARLVPEALGALLVAVGVIGLARAGETSVRWDTPTETPEESRSAAR
jgi:drug/metabolite transporter (DMT)-like permease